MDTETENPLVHRRDELRRIVYGTPGEPPAGVVVELLALEQELIARDDVGRRSPSGAPSPPSGSTTPRRAAEPMYEVDEPPERPPERAPRSRRRFATAVTVLALTAGAIALLGPARDVLSPPRGLEVFERALSVEELRRAGEVSAAAHLDLAAALSLRSVGSAVGYEVWVYRDGERVCLLTQRDFWFDWVSSCVTLDVFRERGLVRRIPAGAISDLTRPRPVAPDDVVLVEWGPQSADVEWRDVSSGEPPPRAASMTYEEWSSARVATRADGS